MPDMSDMSLSGPPRSCLSSVVLCFLGGGTTNRVISRYPRTGIILSSVGLHKCLIVSPFRLQRFSARAACKVPAERSAPPFPYQTLVETLHVRPRICLALSPELLSICLHRPSFDTHTTLEIALVVIRTDLWFRYTIQLDKVFVMVTRRLRV